MNLTNAPNFRPNNHRFIFKSFKINVLTNMKCKSEPVFGTKSEVLAAASLNSETSAIVPVTSL
jgi:hypothetical protein